MYFKQCFGILDIPSRPNIGSNRWLWSYFSQCVSAYLETDREVCISFYEKGGFRVVGELNVFGVQIWRMERPVTVTGMQTRQVRT